MLLALALWPMAAGLLSYLIGRKSPRVRDCFVPLSSACELTLALMLYASIQNGLTPSMTLEGVCGQNLMLCADSFRALWVVLAAFAWLCACLMAPSYLSHGENQNRYHLFTLLTLGATAGVFLSADLLTLFLFFEIMSLASWVWVAHEDTPPARYAADTYLAVAVIGGLVLLMGLFLLHHLAGTLVIAQLRQACLPLVHEPMLHIAGVLLLLGFGAKAGMFPLHFWLPMAHPVAPAPASALLSGLLTKCGIFGVLILCEIFQGSQRWGEAVLGLGLITMSLGAVLAVFAVDLKRTLACSSVSQIGFILVGCGLFCLPWEENWLASNGLQLHMINHALIKTVLFLSAGVFAMNRGTLDLNQLRGAGRKGPLLLKISFAVAGLSVSGVPLFSGYLSKTLLHEGLVAYTKAAEALENAPLLILHSAEWLFLLSGGMTLAYMGKLFYLLFIAKPTRNLPAITMNAAARAAVGMPALLLFVFGVLPEGMERLLRFPFALDPQSTPAALPKVSYFSWENLQGACVSMLLGAAVLLLIARKLMRHGVLLDRWPGWLNLEMRFYRPLVTKLLPGATGFVCRCFDCLLDGLIVLLRATILRSLGRPKRPVAGSEFTDALGRFCDHFAWLLNHTVLRRRPITRSFVYVFAEWEEETEASGRLITASLSFGLLMFCVGLCLALIYLLV